MTLQGRISLNAGGLIYYEKSSTELAGSDLVTSDADSWLLSHLIFDVVLKGKALAPLYILHGNAFDMEQICQHC